MLARGLDTAQVDEAVARHVGAVDSGGGSLGCNSFAGATRVVLADGSSKPIDQVRVGEEVTNAAPGSPFVGPHVVTAVHVTYTDRAFDDVSVATPSGPATITTTARHLFWDVTTRAWTAAQDLRLGDQLDTPGEGRAIVVGSRHYTATITTYNLTIDTTHTYYALAGDTPVLVHNCGGVAENDAGRFGDLSPGTVGDGLTAHHIPQAALGFAARNDGGAIVMTQADHMLTRTYGARNAATKVADAGRSFRDVLADDLWNMRRIGESQHGDPGYFNRGINGLLSYYRENGQL